MSNQGTTVKLRTKKLKSGKLSYYLQFYFPHTRKKKKEYLGLYLLPNLKNPIQKDHNKDIKQLAESILSKKVIEIQEGRFGFMSKEKLNILFLSYFETIMDKKKNSSSNSKFFKLEIYI